MPPRPSAATIRYREARIVPAANLPVPDQLEPELLVLVGLEELDRPEGGREEGARGAAGVSANTVSPPSSVGVELMSSDVPHSGQNRLDAEISFEQEGQRIVVISSI